MEALFPGSRGKRKQGRSHSLPARIDPATPSEFEGERSELLANEHHGIESKSQSHPQAREAISTRSATRKSYLRPSDDWSYLEPDERGAELGEEARVWKVYVGETDKSDAELVDGWNKTLDVLLAMILILIRKILFTEYFRSSLWWKAALFSAISTAFLIESSGMLKQDPNDVSAAALMVISQALVTIAINNYTTGPSAIPLPVQTNAPDFVPSKNAVIINTLWYLSLSLSIATAFLAMLAKDWCHSFSANRTGHPRTQAHRRQRKWKLIERWKMQELIALLPSFVHLSLRELVQK
ncbi:unnamed protein product [Rhizoctonia solani]|uniref:DUF6535 domain-containing protein n=1 Tax=Rhizoctonia solani TaxID=456999 RepID=A0A8H3BHV1_9AGAM|nr:unnamed protein product [Rhizoctonia solani]